MYKTKMLFVVGAMMALSLAACNDDSAETIPDLPLEAVLVEDLHAPGDVVNRQTGEIVQENPFVYFSFETNTQVQATDNWDIAIKGTTIRVNGGISGNGNARAALMDGAFDELTEIPAALIFRQDTQESLAIPSGSGQGWYNYNFINHTVNPIPGRILLIQTHGGKYAKIEIMSYYQGNPPMEQVTRMTPSAYYTFQFMLQPDGSRRFD
jgi:hypothetical protein